MFASRIDKSPTGPGHRPAARQAPHRPAGPLRQGLSGARPGGGEAARAAGVYLAMVARAHADPVRHPAPQAGAADKIDAKPHREMPTDNGGSGGSSASAPATTPAPSTSAQPAPAQSAPVPVPALSAVAFGTVDSATTPGTMGVRRIPPRVDQSVAVALTGAGTATISVEGASNANGTATLNGAATADLSANGTVTLKGTAQTGAGNAGKLRLVAKTGATVLGNSNFFTICAIPTLITITQGDLITGDKRGVKVRMSNNSDSGQVGDLDQVQMSEKVQYLNGTGCFLGITSGNNSGYLPASNTPHGEDSHGMPVSRITGNGALDAEQVFVFKDARSGAADIAVKYSGFNIHRQATATVASSVTTITIKTTKDPMAVTVGGASASAGTGNADSGDQAV